MRKVVKALSIIVAIIIIVVLILGITNSNNYKLITVEITRTGKYNTSDSMNNDDHTIDFVDINTGVQVKDFRIDKDNFYTMKTGNLLKLVTYTKGSNEARYSYNEQIDIKDIKDIPSEEIGKLQSSTINCTVTAKKTVQ